MTSNNVRPLHAPEQRQPGCVDITLLIAIAIVLWGAAIALAIGLVKAVL